MATMLARRIHSLLPCISEVSVNHLYRYSRCTRALAATPASPAVRWQSSVDARSPASYTLYQYRICPFSNIAKVYLKSRGIPYDEVEVNPLTKAELHFSKEGYKKVPILTICDGDSPDASQQLNGSESIVAYFEETTAGVGSSTDDISKELDGYARNKLAPLLYPNLCESLSASFNAFNYVHTTPNNFSQLQKYMIQYVGAVAMYFAASKVKKKHGIDDARKALEDELLFLEQKLDSQEFLGDTSSNEKLSVGDLSVFGVLKGLEGLPISIEIMNDSRYTRLGQWYRKVDEMIA